MRGVGFTVVVPKAVACALGIIGGHTASAAVGVAAVLTVVATLFRALQLLGGGLCVVSLGVDAVVAARTPGGGGRRARGAVRPMRQGFVTTALGPKAPITFLSPLPQSVPAGAPALPRTLLPALIVVGPAQVRFPAWCSWSDRLGRWLRRLWAVRAVEAVTGTVLTGLGALLLLEPLLSL